METPGFVADQIVLGEPSRFAKCQAETRVPQKEMQPDSLSITNYPTDHIPIVDRDAFETCGNSRILLVKIEL